MGNSVKEDALYQTSPTSWKGVFIDSIHVLPKSDLLISYKSCEPFMVSFHFVTTRGMSEEKKKKNLLFDRQLIHKPPFI